MLLDDSLKEALNPWMDPDFLRCPIPIRRYTFSDSTDASLDAYIEVLLPHSVRSLWPLGWVGMSMYWKELKAVHLSLIRFQDQLKGHCIRILSDSSGLHQERGFAGFRVSLGSVKGPASLCPIQGYLSVSSASEEEIEGPSRQGFEGWSHQHRMVLRPWFL